MGIKDNTPKDMVERTLEEYEQRIKDVVLRNLMYIGETAITIARDTSSAHTNNYMDQTGNLRSSIGYKVAYNGKIVGGSKFDKINTGAEGSKGGKELAERIAKDNSLDGFCLVLVAGMKYAYYVEAGHTAKNGRYIEPRDVLTSAEQKAIALANKLLSNENGKAD